MAFFLILASLIHLFGFSHQSYQCQQKYVEEADGKYNFVVDCSNLGLDSFPSEVSELATILYLNGNRLKSIDARSMEKLVYLEVLDLSANDITSLPHGIFDKNKKMKRLDLGRNRLHCDWRIWWLVNFTKTLETFNGHCLSPKSLRGRDIRKLTEKDVIVDCASRRKLSNQSEDGHYTFHVAGSGGANIELLIYCHNMGTDTPNEYLTLPSGPHGNFIRSNAKHSMHCLKDNETSGHLSASIGFKKIRLLLRSLTVIPDDLTFATANNGGQFGNGKICGMGNSSDCFGADAMIDLRGTPFKVKESVNWNLPIGSTGAFISKKFNGAVTEVNCSASCTGCSLATPLSLEPMDSRLTPYEACSRPLGIQDGRIPSQNITASSHLDRNFLPQYARLFSIDRGGWCAGKQDKSQFIQVDLGSVFTVSGISTQGYQTYSDWVRSYKIVYKGKDDSWKDYTIFGNTRVFQGNIDSTSVVTHWLDPRFRARVIRIQPLSWYNGDLLDHRICMRFEIYGCKNDVSSYIIKLGENKPCILPETGHDNITDGTELIFDSHCAGTNFMFRFGQKGPLVHSMSGLCLGMNNNLTAILSSNCSESSFEYKRIAGKGFENFNLIVKHKSTGKCVRFKRDKETHRIKVSLRKCGDIFQMLLVLIKNGVTPLKPTFRETRETRRVDMWSKQLLHCAFTSDPQSIFAWSKDSPIIDGGLKLVGRNFRVLNNRSLLIENTTWNDRGNYFCSAMNSEGSAIRVVKLNVNAMQAFIVKPSNQQTIVGQMVKFECHVEGIPKPRILWRVRRHNRKGFVRVDSLDQRRFRLMPNGTLVIFNVHFTDQGLYACIAKSPGKKNNATAYLTVFVPPNIALSSTKKSLFVGDSTRVTCHATGEPFPTIVWYKSPWVNMTNPRNLGLVDGNISFKEVSKKDAGLYICIAKNHAGSAFASFQLDVTATCSFIHIRYSHVNPRKSFFYENEHVTVRCQKGFHLIGAGKLRCTSYGNWSHPFPRCVDIDECSTKTSDSAEGSGLAVNVDTEPDVCHVNAVCTNTVGSYQCACEEGYDGNGFLCTWRTTTTKTPTTTLILTTTTHRPTVKLGWHSTEPSKTEVTQEDEVTTATTTEVPSGTTAMPYEPSMLNVILNFTKGYISEYRLLSGLLDHSRSIGKLSSMEHKLKNLNVSLSALRTILEPKYQRAVSSRHVPWENLKMFSNIVSSLLDSESTKVWKKRGETSSDVTELLQIVDDYCHQQLKYLEGFYPVMDGEIKTNNIVVKLKNLDSPVDDNEVSTGAKISNSYQAKMTFQKDSLPKNPKPAAILVLYKNLDGVLKERSAERIKFVSKIASLTVTSIKDGTTLKSPVQLTFTKQMSKPSSPECVFWKFDSIKGSGTWSQEGCRLYKNGSKYESESDQVSESTITCECDHLTTFAVIQRKIPATKSDDSNLFVLTMSLSVIIGCGISIFFAFLTCISHLCFSSHVRSDRRIVMINTCACILLGSVIFLGGAMLSSFKLIKGDISKYFCLAFSGSLQLFFIAFFCWMLAEAIQIYLSTRTVIDKGSGKLTMFYLFGWGFPALMVGLSLVLITYNKIQITSWCWIDLSSYSHFLLTGIPVFSLFIITVILYAFISTSLKKNKDLLNPFVQKYTKFALWCSPILLILHVMTILAVSAFLSFNNNLITHYILGALYGLEGIFLVVYQCYIEKVVLSKAGAMAPKRGKRRHSYSVKDTVTYGEEVCIEDGNGKYLIRRPSRRSLQDTPKGIKGSARSELDCEFESNYFDMYGTSERKLSAKSPSRVPVVIEDEVDESGELLKDDTTEDSNETGSELRETQLTSFDASNGSELGSRKKGPSTCGSVISVETVNTSENIFKRKPSSNCGSIVSIEVKPRQHIQGIPVYFPGSAPPQHVLTLERKKKEYRPDSEEKYDNVDFVDDTDAISSKGSKGSTDPDRISNISNELTCILKELEAFSSDTATPVVPRKTGKAASATGHADMASSPVWQKRRPPYERQASVEMTDIRPATGQRYRTDWYGEVKDTGDGLRNYQNDLYTSV